jgi:hypothetical protein
LGRFGSGAFSWVLIWLSFSEVQAAPADKVCYHTAALRALSGAIVLKRGPDGCLGPQYLMYQGFIEENRNDE